MRRSLRALALTCALVACAHEPTTSPSPRDDARATSRAGAWLREPVQRVREPSVWRADAPPRNLPEAPPALSEKLTRPARRLIVALGDLHGDLDATRRALLLAQAIDDSDRWIGGDMTLVQTGDVLDRGDDDRAILDLLVRLRDEAAEAGGEVILLSGNHELMNTMASFGYVTPGGFAAFGGERGRREAFQPGGPYAALLAELPIVIKVGDNVFVHGGILPEHIRYGLDRMNDEAQAFMRGELTNLPAVLSDADGVLWTRLYSYVPDSPDCYSLRMALQELGAKRMVVGHTPQLSGITSGCDGQVLRIDTGMSRYYGGPVQVLEIQGDIVRMRKEGGQASAPAAVR